MTYEEQLLTPEWQAKRDEIIRRDWYMCQECMSSQNLQVHHKKYIKGRMAWEYDGWDSFELITLCRKCHADKHGIFIGGPYIDGRPVLSIRQVVEQWALHMIEKHG